MDNLLTVSDVTLDNTRPTVPDQRAPVGVQSCTVTEQTGTVGNSSPWTEEEIHCYRVLQQGLQSGAMI